MLAPRFSVLPIRTRCAKGQVGVVWRRQSTPACIANAGSRTCGAGMSGEPIPLDRNERAGRRADRRRLDHELERGTQADDRADEIPDFCARPGRLRAARRAERLCDRREPHRRRERAGSAAAAGHRATFAMTSGAIHLEARPSSGADLNRPVDRVALAGFAARSDQTANRAWRR
jgi:hypothetical protein